jgi:hypothetical protein
MTKILEIDSCENCRWRAKFNDRCLHDDTFNRETDKEYYPAIPDWCPLQDKGVSFPIDIKHTQVIAFANAMDEVLCKNDYKGGWRESGIQYLRARLVEEMGEYFARIAINIEYEATKPLDARDKELERKELIDVSNLSMMLWDKS